MGSIEAIEQLLRDAKAAHAEYERTQLNGVYDAGWPAWYASFLAEHGLPALVGRPVSAEEVAALLEGSWAEQERTASDEPWESYTARRVLAVLGDGPRTSESIT